MALLRLAALGLVTIGLVAAAGGTPTHPPIVVTRFDDPAPDGCSPLDCSVREALILANSVPGTDKVLLPGGTYDLLLGGGAFFEDSSLSSDLDITDDLIVQGGGAESTVIQDSATMPERAFDVLPGVAVGLSGLTIRNLPGSPETFFACGRGIRSRGDLTLENVAILRNFMRGDGGGVCNDGGTLVIRDSVISGNCACLHGWGGGIYSVGTAILERVVVSENRADIRSGGGIWATGSIEIRDSVIASNEAFTPVMEGRGGGASAGGNVVITNTTISGNATKAYTPSPGDNVGAGLNLGGDVVLTNVTITGNESATTAGGLYYWGGGALTMVNTIIAGNTGGDCEGAVTSGGHNIDGDGSCGLGAAGDMAGADPLLGPLADNGGPTQTHALLAGSPAIDAGDAAACPPGDQRGFVRPAGAGCDIGSFESGAPEPSPSPSPSPTPTFSPVVRGDADCDEDADSVDALAALRLAAGLSTDAGCLLAANVDCSLAVDSVDALLILRYVAALPVALPPGCPAIGSP